MPEGYSRRSTYGARTLLVAVTALALAVQPVGPGGGMISAARAQASPGQGNESTSLYGPAQPPLRQPPAATTDSDFFPSAPRSVLPDLGEESQATMSLAQESKIGEMVVRQIRAAGAYLDDPEVNDYLNVIGHRLVAAIPESRQEFEFFAVGDSAINAFALPGGYIGVNMGLILMTQTESELAAVLAHEITHVTQRHMARRAATEKNQMLYMLAGLALAIAASRGGSASSGQATQAAIASGQALAVQSQINFTRENEYEADRIGFQRLEAAGFDVYAMATLMDRMQKATKFSDGNAPSYLRSHPVTLERIAEAQARAYGKPYRQVPDSLDFHMVRALLRSYQGAPKDTVAYFRNSIAEHKYNSEVAAQYGLVASLLRNEEFQAANVELAKLEKIAPPHPMVEAMAGHVLMESGKLDQAIDRFKSALARYPNKMQLIYDYPQALMKAGRLREAAAFLETELARYPNDGPLHGIAARAYADLGQKQQEHRHQGELYAWQGDFKEAVRQFELASKANDGDFYQTSVVEARLRALRKELTEQVALGKNG